MKVIVLRTTGIVTT